MRGAIAALALASGAIHFAMAPDHFGEYWLFGTFMVVSAWLQLWLAAAVVLRASKRAFQIGFLLQSSIVVLWIITRTSGIPVGPDHWTPESIAPVDALCTGFEAATAIGFLALLMPRVRGRVVLRELGAAFVGGISVLALGLATFALTPTGLGAESGGGGSSASSMPGMNMSGSGGSGGSSPVASPSPASTGSTSKASEASQILKTSATMQIEGMTVPVVGGSGVLGGAAVPGCSMKAMRMVGHQVGACTSAPVTTAEADAASSLVLRTRAALVNFPTLQSAYAAGYHDANVTAGLYHVTNNKYLADGKTLDPSAIESLVYYKFPSGSSLLLGAMYLAEPGQNGTLIGGALTSWHEHTNLCVNELKGTAMNPLPGGKCAPGSAVEPTGQMLHVWAVPYTGGPFADIDGPALTTAITKAVQSRGGLAGMG